MTPIRRRCGDYPELFWNVDADVPLEIVFSEPRGATPEHIRIRWRRIPDAPELHNLRGNDGKAA
ncbi:hypothetical protein BH24GEM3_BH24GEM3_08680 [soil metagenome]|jgi:hypothetical protein